MFKFTIRDVLWLTAVAALGVTLYIKHREHEHAQREISLELKLSRERNEMVRDWSDMRTTLLLQLRRQHEEITKLRKQNEAFWSMYADWRQWRNSLDPGYIEPHPFADAASIQKASPAEN